MSDLVKIIVTVIFGVGLLFLAYTWYGSSLPGTRGGGSIPVTPQYGPVYMPKMR